MFYSILKAPPYDVAVLDAQDGSKLCALPIARGVDEVRIVNVVSELAPFIRNDQDAWEFTFSIEVFALDGSVEGFQTQDRTMAVPYIPAECRPVIMDVVCAQLASLAESVRPELVYWVTLDRNIHPRALPKYTRLINALGDAGYHVAEEGTDAHGRTFWVLRR